MPVDGVGQYGPLAGAFAAGCAAAWGFANRVMVPERLKALEAELKLVKAEVDKLTEKANKYDALNERLAAGALARLE